MLKIDLPYVHVTLNILQGYKLKLRSLPCLEAYFKTSLIKTHIPGDPVKNLFLLLRILCFLHQAVFSINLRLKFLLSGSPFLL